MGKIIAGYWDCEKCGNKKNTATARECPHCGGPRSEHTVFYYDETSRVLSEEEAGRVSRNPDWHCPYCGSLNGDGLTHCPSCGHGREEGDPDYFALREQQKQRAEKKEGSASPQRTEPPKKKRRLPWILLAACLALAGLLVFLLVPRSFSADILQKDWAQHIAIEKHTLVSDSGWTLPGDAEQTDARQEIHHYVQELSHYESVAVQRERISGYRQVSGGMKDLGNGFFEEITYDEPVYETYTEYEDQPVYIDVPVYQTKYYYTQWRWVYARTVTTQGTGGEPYWGEPRLGKLERESQRHGDYEITVEHQNERYTCALPYERWEALSVGDTCRFEKAPLDDGVRLMEE